MPCYYDPMDYVPGYRAGKDAMRSELDKLTRMLCEVLNFTEDEVEMRAMQRYLSKEVMEWWDKHKKFDAKRKK